MELTQVRELLNQVQGNARVSTAIGDPIQVGERVVIPVVEVSYGGGGFGGGGKMDGDNAIGSGGVGGGGVHVRPLGCWIIGPDSERWVAAVDINRAIVILGSLSMILLITVRTLLLRRRRR